MLQFLENIDIRISLFINSLHCSALNFFMYHITQLYCSVVIYAAVIVLFVAIKKNRFWIDVLFLLLAVAFVAVAIEFFVKPCVARLRPCNTEELQGLLHIVKGYKATAYSFFSSHAATSFAIAVYVFLSLRRKYISTFILIWAILYSYSRIYLGVHFLGDVICGMIFGTVCAWAMYKLKCYIAKEK